MAEDSKNADTGQGLVKTVVPEDASKETDTPEKAEDTDLTQEDPEDLKVNKEKCVRFELKNTLIMLVVALISVVFSFILVSRKSTSFDENKIKVQDVNNVPAVENTGGVPQGDAGVKPQNKEEKVNKIKDEKVKADKVNKTGAENGKSGNIDNDKEAAGIQDSIVVPLESVVVNLGGIDSNRYLRIQVNLEVDSEDTQKLINEKIVIIRDKMISFFSTKTMKDLNTEGGLFKLRLEIKDSLNKLLGSNDKIRKIYISDFIVQ